MTNDTSSCPMKSALEFVGLSTVVLVAIVVAAFCTELGPMYLFWILGTALACVITAASGIYLDAQHGYHGDKNLGDK